jgi:hypothetical protein
MRMSIVNLFWDMCQFQQEMGHGEGFDLPLEEFVIGKVSSVLDFLLLLNFNLSLSLHSNFIVKENYLCLAQNRGMPLRLQILANPFIISSELLQKKTVLTQRRWN